MVLFNLILILISCSSENTNNIDDIKRIDLVLSEDESEALTYVNHKKSYENQHLSINSQKNDASKVELPANLKETYKDVNVEKNLIPKHPTVYNHKRKQHRHHRIHKSRPIFSSQDSLKEKSEQNNVSVLYFLFKMFSIRHIQISISILVKSRK